MCAIRSRIRVESPVDGVGRPAAAGCSAMEHVMIVGMGRFFAAAVSAAVFLGACSSAEPLSPIATGSARGGEFADGFYNWELRPSRANTRGVDLYVPGVGISSLTVSVYADGPDDAAWVIIAHPAVDAANVVIGGARADVDEVILMLDDGTEVSMEFFDVEGRSWNAVMAELPRKWMASGGFSWEAVAFKDGVEVSRDERLDRS